MYFGFYNAYDEYIGSVHITTVLGQFNFLLFVQMSLLFYTMNISHPASYAVSYTACRRSACCLSHLCAAS